MALVPQLAFAPALAPLVLRAAAGSALAYHGYLKIEGGASKFADFVATREVFGLALPSVTGYAVIGIELLGGLCLLAGLLTRVWGALVTGHFIMIILVMKPSAGLIAPQGADFSGFELELFYAAIAATLFLLGPGPFSVDRVIGMEEAPAPRREPAAVGA